MNSINSIKIIQPDDWHVHLRDDEMMSAVIEYSSRINHRCIVMPNLEVPITNMKLGIKYLKKINAKKFYLQEKSKNQIYQKLSLTLKGYIISQELLKARDWVMQLC